MSLAGRGAHAFGPRLGEDDEYEGSSGAVSTWAVRAVQYSLILAWLGPLASHLVHGPDISGIESATLILGWLGVIVLRGSVRRRIDIGLVIFLCAALLSAVCNRIQLDAAALEFALYAAPFLGFRLLLEVSDKDMRVLLRTVGVLWLLQWALFAYQIARFHGAVDSLQGTLIGAGAGAHLASFFVVMGAVVVAKAWSTSRTGSIFVGVAVVAEAYVADAKQVLVYAAAAAAVYVLANGMGRRVAKLGKRRALGIVAASGLFGIMWAYLAGAFGGITGFNYFSLTKATGGGKLAVATLLLSPASPFWSDHSVLVGAGPAQTVSRSAELTVPGAFHAAPPAARLGIREALYFPMFANAAEGHGFVGASSITSAPSSMLGLVGDLGIVGTASYLYLAFVMIRKGGLRAAALWLPFILLLGTGSEWLEFPSVALIASVVQFVPEKDRAHHDGLVQRVETVT